MKIEKENFTLEDTKDSLIKKEEGYTCGCGNPRLKLVLHVVGNQDYSFQYHCDNCGNDICITGKRNNRDRYM